MTTPVDREFPRFADVAHVLDAAEDPSVPLANRLRRLAEAGTVLEELFRLYSLAAAVRRRRGKTGNSLARARYALAAVLDLQDRLGRTWCDGIVRKLARMDIRFIARTEMTTFARSWVRTYFETHVVDGLDPRILREYTGIDLAEGCHLVAARAATPAEWSSAPPWPVGLVPLPPSDRIVMLPDVGEGRPLMWLDDVIRANLDRLVQDFVPGEAFAVRIVRLTRDDLAALPEGKARDRLAMFLEANGGSWRLLEYDRSIPYPLLVALRDALGLADDQLLPVGRYPAIAGLVDMAGMLEPPAGTQPTEVRAFSESSPALA